MIPSIVINLNKFIMWGKRVTVVLYSNCKLVLCRKIEEGMVFYFLLEGLIFD